MRVTARSLQKSGACEEGVEDFLAYFPGGCKVTRENIILARNFGLHVEWWAHKTIPGFCFIQTSVLGSRMDARIAAKAEYDKSVNNGCLESDAYRKLSEDLENAYDAYCELLADEIMKAIEG